MMTIMISIDEHASLRGQIIIEDTFICIVIVVYQG